MLKESSVESSLTSSCLTPEFCAGCSGKILDRWYLVAVDRRWHLGCLTCVACRSSLDAHTTCFQRHGNIYCKHDYYRLFGVKRCSRCGLGICSSELVMRARDYVYHLNCFACVSCGILLTKGDIFGLREGLIYCRPHYELVREYLGDDHGRPLSPPPSPWPQIATKGRPRKRRMLSPELQSNDSPINMTMPVSTAIELLSPCMDHISHETSLTPTSGVSPPSCYDHTPPGQSSSATPTSTVYEPTTASMNNGICSSSANQLTRTKRMRTSFKHHQLRTMKSYFNINQNPDAKDLKQLAQKTGLSKRVLQVWFQNARAKWRRNLMRQEGGMTNNGTNPNSIGTSDTASLDHQSDDQSIHQSMTFSDLY